MTDQSARLSFAIDLARRAAALGLSHFRSLETLTIESKGHQDLVSNADKEVETFVRAEIAKAYPEDGIVGEEHATVGGTTGHVWIIDPIDGTANFVSGIPAWCVVIACAFEGEAEIGVVCEPSHDETYWAERGHGAFLNGKPIKVSPSAGLNHGSVATGYAARQDAEAAVRLISGLIARGGMFYRNASGALMLSYVAAGRLIGYVEEHMNSWDCLAALLIIEEAGGTILKADRATVVEQGARIIAAGPLVYPDLESLAREAYGW